MSHRSLLLVLLTFITPFLQEVKAQSFGFSPSSIQAVPQSDAIVEFWFARPEDPQRPHPVAMVKYVGSGIFLSGLSVNISYEPREVIHSFGPVDSPGEGRWHPYNISACTDYDDASDTCLNGWQSDANELSMPTLSGDVTVEKTLAFKVTGEGVGVSGYGELYPMAGQAVTTMTYTLVPEPEHVYRDGDDVIAIWTQRAVQVPNDRLKKPLLVAEGIDLTNGTWTYTTFGRLKGLALQARNEGMDIAVISFQDPLSSIRQHEGVMRRAIKLIHSLKQNASRPTAVAGISRGGVVARYALAKMEENGVAHHTSLFLSYDAPQRGANVNLNLQEFLLGDSEYADRIPQKYKTQFRSQAVKELLIEHAEHNQPVTEQETLFNEIASLNGGYGYPQQPRLVAWSNGTWTQPTFDTNLAFKIILEDADDLEFPLTYLDMVPGSYLPESLQPSESGFTDISRLQDWIVNLLLLDLLGIYPDPAFSYRFVQVSDPTFIPTFSSLDKDSESSPTKFDRIGIADVRSSHAAFSEKAAAFVLGELRYAFGDNTLPASIVADRTISGTWFVGGTTVSHGATLTLEPGTRLFFNAGKSLTIEPGAKIIAEGTAGNEIRFESTDASEPWGSVVVKGDGSRFEHCIFQGAEFYALTIRAQEVHVRECMFKNNDYYALKARQTPDGQHSSFTVKNSTFKNNDGGISAWYADATITGSTFTSNRFSGISAANNSNITIRSSDFNGGAHGVELGSGVTASVLYNSVSDYSWGLDASQVASVTITGNTFTDNYWCGICLGSTEYASIQDNTIKNSEYYGIDISFSDVPVFKRNVIENNGSMGIWVGASTFLYMNAKSRNRIRYNGDSEILLLDEAARVYLGNTTYDAGGHNDIYDSAYGSNNYYVENGTSQTIKAENNYWGQSSPT